MSRSRGQAAAAGMGALLILLALIAGLPALLYRLGGSPLPGHLPGATQVGHALLHRDSASLVLAAVRDVSWIAWALFTLAVLAEVQAVLRRRTAPRLRLGGMQSAAGLVALAALTFTAAPVGTLLTTPQPVPAVLQADVTPGLAAPFTIAPHARPAVAPGPAVAPPAPARHARSAAPDAGAGADAGPGLGWGTGAGPGDSGPAAMAGPRAETVAAVTAAGESGARAGSAQEEGMGFIQLVTVRPGDCLWTIAQQHLGHGDLYHEIVALNLGHDMGDGQIFANPSVIQPGWVLHVPADPGAPPPGRPQPGSGSPAPGSGGAGGTHAGHPTSSPSFGHPHAAATPPATPAATASPRPGRPRP